MTTILEEWNRILARRGPGAAPADLILRSWTRSHAAGLDPSAPQLRVPRIPHRELRRLLAENRRLIEAARPHLHALSRDTPVPHVAYIACVEGIVLHSTGDDEAQMEALGLLPGFDWSEATMGTNGAGTAIVEARPVTILGQDHYLEPLKGFLCTAAPLRDHDGRVIGAVDLSTSVDDGRPEILLRIIHAAAAIEADLRR